jgi:hypothetical protein
MGTAHTTRARVFTDSETGTNNFLILLMAVKLESHVTDKNKIAALEKELKTGIAVLLN